MNAFTFTANAGDTVDIWLANQDTIVDGYGNPQLGSFMYAPDGTLLPTANYFVGNRVIHFDTLPQTGTYLLFCVSNNGTSTGTYTISLLKKPGAYHPGGGPVVSGGMKTATIGVGAWNEVTFYALKGDTADLWITQQSGNLSLDSELRAPDGTPLNDANGNTSYHNNKLPQTGTYLLLSRDDSGTNAGTFTVALNLSSICQPDMLIRNAGESGYTGAGILNLDGTDQSRSQIAATGSAANYQFLVQNAGSTTDSFTITAPGSGGGWVMHYFDQAANDISSAVTGSGWTTGNLAPGAGTVFSAQVMPDITIGAGAVNAVLVTAMSNMNPSMQDAVNAVTTAVVVPPPTISSFTPVSGPIGQLVTITGTNFTGASSVKFNGTTATNFTVVNSNATAITATVPTGASSGKITVTTPRGTATSTANFTVTFTVSPSAGANGAIGPNTTQTVNYGGSITFNATANAGFTVDTWTVDGAFGQTGSATCTLTNVTANHTINVTFRGLAALTLTKAVTPTAVPSPGTVLYTLSYGNNGLGTATNVTLTDTLPANIAYVSGSATGGAKYSANKLTWTLTALNAGATAQVTFQATVNANLPGGTNIANTAAISCFEKPTPVVSNTAIFSVAPVYQPDVSIYTSGDAGYTGVNVFNTAQTRSLTVTPTVTALYYLHVQNDGNTADTFTVTAPAGGNGWTVVYKDLTNGLVDITTSITGTAGWSSGLLAPGAVKFLSVQVTPGNSVAASAVNTLTVAAVSANDVTKQDAVQALTTAAAPLAKYQPDLSIYATGDTAYTGVNVFNTTQTRGLTIAPNATAIYYFHAQNDGNTTDTFTIKAPAGVSGWKLVYKDMTTTLVDVTTAITSAAGWSSGPVAPGAYKFFSVQVTPDNTVMCGAVNTITLTAVSTGDKTKQDAVQAVTTAGGRYQPDLSIDANGDAGYTGVGVFNTTGTGQTRGLTVATNVAAIYYFHVQNSGNTTDIFTVNAPAGGSGWKLVYKDLTTTMVDISTAITSTLGWSTGPLAPGGYKFFSVQVTPDNTVACSAVNTLTLSAVSTNDATKQDMVKALTTATILGPRYQPDLSIDASGDTGYTGVNIFNTSGANQTRNLTVAPNVTAVYYFHVQNAGNTGDTFTVKALAGGSGWKVAYKDLTTTMVDITTAITSTAGWSSGLLAPGAYKFLAVQVTPDTTVTSGAIATLSLTAVSNNDATKQDVVQAVTTRQ